MKNKGKDKNKNKFKKEYSGWIKNEKLTVELIKSAFPHLSFRESLSRIAKLKLEKGAVDE